MPSIMHKYIGDGIDSIPACWDWLSGGPRDEKTDKFMFDAG
jgi:hypothetical protein